eukprot:6572928-Lingulodinium_polyedra.AAC.1
MHEPSCAPRWITSVPSVGKARWIDRGAEVLAFRFLPATPQAWPPALCDLVAATPSWTRSCQACPP